MKVNNVLIILKSTLRTVTYFNSLYINVIQNNANSPTKDQNMLGYWGMLYTGGVFNKMIMQQIPTFDTLTCDSLHLQPS
jgi:hypothetical protein